MPDAFAPGSDGLAAAILDSLTANVALVDSTGAIVAANAAWKRYARDNQSRDQYYYIGANYLAVCETSVGHGEAESAAAAMNGIRSVLQREQDCFTLEYPCHSPTDKRWFRLQVTRLALDRPAACVVSHEDITAKKIAEEELRETERQLRASLEHNVAAQAHREELEEQLRESQKMEVVGTLAGGIAHDFNNILAVILGNAEMASQDAGVNESVQESLQEIDKAAVRGRDLVKQILGFVRKQNLELVPISLETVMLEAVRLLRATLSARLTIELDCEAGVPQVAADASQILQVLVNLAANAMQAIPAGPGTIALRLQRVRWAQQGLAPMRSLRSFAAAHPEGSMCVTVSDTGNGMDAATKERVFDPFFTTRRMGEGTGLGLSIVRGIVQAHGGEIRVDSRPGEGATFFVYLPIANAEAAVGTSDPSRDEAGWESIPLRAWRILYVDDDDSVLSMFKRLMERQGHRVTGYRQAGDALVGLRANPTDFDLVLTDYNMPGMSGLDLALQVKAIRNDLPVVIASGYIDERLRTHAEAAGATAVIFKASGVAEFCDSVRQAVLSMPERARHT